VFASRPRAWSADQYGADAVTCMSGSRVSFHSLRFRDRHVNHAADALVNDSCRAPGRGGSRLVQIDTKFGERTEIQTGGIDPTQSPLNVKAKRSVRADSIVI
jgi:hypothetical protein